MDKLAVFAKYWEPSRVKTRLAATIGAAAAAEIHRLSLLTLLDRFARLGQRRVLVFSPSDREPAFRAAIPDTWELQPQAGGGLGERIVAHFGTSSTRGVTRAVIIGSDSPTLPASRIEQGFEALHRVDVVVGPSDDGGFFLLGLRLDRITTEELSQWLAEMPWSTSQVWPVLHERLTAACVLFQTLEPWYDVDSAAELSRLNGELAELAPRDPLWLPLANAVRDALAK